MTAPTPPYFVSIAPAIVDQLEKLQRRANRQGRGEAALEAFKEIIHQLQQDAPNVGEPSYGLSSLRLQVRTVAVRPLIVHFAVHEERPIVFINRARLLSQ